MKKLIIYYCGFLVILLLSFIFFASAMSSLSNSRINALSESDFILKAEKLNTKVNKMDIITQNDDKALNNATEIYLQKNIKKSLYAINDNLLLKYLKCSNERCARLLFDSEYEELIQKKTKSSKESNQSGKVNSESISNGKTRSLYNGKNFNYVEVHTKLQNFLLARVDDTYIGIISYDDELFMQAKDLFGFLDFSNYFHEAISKFMSSFFISMLIIAIYVTIPLAFIFKKTNVHPFIAFVPLLNLYFLCMIADKSGWKVLFFLFPVVNVIYVAILNLRLARVFGKSDLFGVGIIFAPIIFLPIIAFGNSEYIGKLNNAN